MANALDEPILAVLRSAGHSMTAREIAKELPDRWITYRERPPYRADRHWLPSEAGNMRGTPCCQSCTDPSHVVRRRYRWTGSDVVAKLKGMARRGLVRNLGKHPGPVTHGATFFWGLPEWEATGAPHGWPRAWSA
jgi:hypothetical protein